MSQSQDGNHGILLGPLRWFHQLLKSIFGHVLVIIDHWEIIVATREFEKGCFCFWIDTTLFLKMFLQTIRHLQKSSTHWNVTLSCSCAVAETKNDSTQLQRILALWIIVLIWDRKLQKWFIQSCQNLRRRSLHWWIEVAFYDHSISRGINLITS